MSGSGTLTGVILVAAGSGQRLGFDIPKARVLCGGVTLLEHALGNVLASGVAHEIVVVIPAGDISLADVAEAAPGNARVTTVPGGPSRAASVRAGLTGLSDAVGRVLVHDAARALTPGVVFQRVEFRLAAGAAAVIPVLPVVDTVKIVRNGQVAGTPGRAELRIVQTPQGFDADVLRSAHQRADAADPAITDDAMLVELQGTPVVVVDGDPLAFKITTPLDLALAETLVAGKIPSLLPEWPKHVPERP
uniref:2-C-methyl-D-erythritol 4-phosphate cytidylyltransferase n=1 Tax=Arthrobacter sp. H41 TaxID=1312978 RepID=UPI00067658F0|nr:2-C-methyl-D-erythritol 4-phosphate cytidylyltransferase [Arthrobacter sp. H41]